MEHRSKTDRFMKIVTIGLQTLLATSFRVQRLKRLNIDLDPNVFNFLHIIIFIPLQFITLLMFYITFFAFISILPKWYFRRHFINVAQGDSYLCMFLKFSISISVALFLVTGISVVIVTSFTEN